MKLKKGVKIVITDETHEDFGEKYYILSKILYNDDLWMYGKNLNQIMGDGYANSNQFEIIKEKEAMNPKEFDIEAFVYEYPTKNKEGFTGFEVKEIYDKFPFEINQEKFDDAMMGNTCLVINNQTVYYHCDIIKALRCGLENRNMFWWEMD